MDRRDFFRGCAALACSAPTLMAGESPVPPIDINSIDWSLTTLRWEEPLKFDVGELPLPIIHRDFTFPPRTESLY